MRWFNRKPKPPKAPQCTSRKVVPVVGLGIFSKGQRWQEIAYCTRAEGHTGDHVQEAEWIATWPQREGYYD